VISGVVCCSLVQFHCETGSESTQKFSGSSPGRDDILIPAHYDADDEDDDDDDDDNDDDDDDGGGGGGRSGERLVS